MYENKCCKCEPFEVEKINECSNKENCMYGCTNKVIKGMGTDAEVIINDKGGKQSKVPMVLHLFDADFLNDWFNDNSDCPIDLIIKYITSFMKTQNKTNLIMAVFELQLLVNPDANEDMALLTISNVLQEGAKKYAPNNWRLIPQESHINHALNHYIAYKMGDTQDDHLGHCMARLMMAYATKLSDCFSYTEYKHEI